MTCIRNGCDFLAEKKINVKLFFMLGRNRFHRSSLWRDGWDTLDASVTRQKHRHGSISCITPTAWRIRYFFHDSRDEWHPSGTGSHNNCMYKFCVWMKSNPSRLWRAGWHSRASDEPRTNWRTISWMSCSTPTTCLICYILILTFIFF